CGRRPRSPSGSRSPRSSSIKPRNPFGAAWRRRGRCRCSTGTSTPFSTNAAGSSHATLPAQPAMRRELTVEQQRARAAMLFIVPALVLVGLFFLLPVVASFLLSVTDFDLYALANLRNVRFVGLHNYAALAGNSEFWSAVANTFYFALVGGPL